MKSNFVLQCVNCKSELTPIHQDSTCARCGSALETVYDYETAKETLSRKELEKRQPTVWKYLELLPTNSEHAVTLGEGGTRLVTADRLGRELELSKFYLKDESRNPTYSFKDRKSTVAVSKAREFNVETITSATAGNAGASIAAYAAKAGIRAVIFAFRIITKSKLSKLLSYGSEVLIVNGTSWDVFQLVTAACAKYGWYNLVAASKYNPYVKDGAKTMVLEIGEQLGWGMPDWLIVPVGGGCGLASCWKGAKELRQLGLIEKLPKLVGVQGADCAPLVKAFDEGTPPDKIARLPNAHTIAHSIEDDYPPDGDQALTAIRESGGLALGIEDTEILCAQKLIGKKEGLFVEPASAAPVAAAKLLLERGIIDRNECVVTIATGSGLNEPESAFEPSQETQTIQPTIQDLERALRSLATR